MKTYFWREGKTVSYEELLEILKQIINREVIDGLEDEEVNKLYAKIYDSAYESIKTYLEIKDYKIINARQCMLTAYKTKLCNNQSLFDEALARRQALESQCLEEAYSKSLRDFIKEDYYPALKGMESKLCPPQFGSI